MKKNISLIILSLFLVSCNNFEENIQAESVVSVEDDVETSLEDSIEKDEVDKNDVQTEVEVQDDLKENNNIKYNKKYTLKGNTSDEFAFLMTENPIDLEYEKICDNYDGSSLMLMQIEDDYKNWWASEMETAYTELQNLLEGEDLEQLKKSQVAFLEYLNGKDAMDTSFYVEQKYDTIGNLRTSMVYSENAELVKNRAYTLLEYVYILTGEINFVFDENIK